MSRKDYRKFAALFAGEMALALGVRELIVIRNIIFSTADLFAQDNSAFNRAKFYLACGLRIKEDKWQ